MKRHLLFLFAVILTISATGRSAEQIARPDSPRKIKEGRQHRSYMPEKPKPERTPRQNLYLQRALMLKSQNDYIKQLDSIYVESSDYMSQELMLEDKYLLAYDSKGNLKSETYFVWDEDANEWLADWKDEFTFNEAGFITSETWYQWDALEEDWVLSDIVEFNYDDNGNLIRITHSEWWEEDAKWVPYWKDEFEYDDDGLLIEEISWTYYTSENGWEEDWKIVYEYDESGNLISGTEYEWDYIDELWIPDFQYEYTYDADGNQIDGMYSYWNEDQEIFELSYKSEYLRDGDGNLISLTYSEYDGGIWYPYLEYEYKYDANLNLTEEITYYYDEDEQVWFQDTKYVYIIDDSFTSGEILTPWYWDYFFASYKNMITAIVVYSGPEDELTIEHKTTLYYNDYEPVDDPEPDTWTLTLTIQGNGTVNVNGEPYTSPITVDNGTQLNLEALADEGYEFIEWTGDLVSSDAQATLTMIFDRDITAVFEVLSSAVVIESTRPGIYPNPFQDNITLSNAGDITIVRITSMTGQTLREFNLTGSDTQTLSAGDLDAGIYLFILQSKNGERIIRKLIKN